MPLQNQIEEMKELVQQLTNKIAELEYENSKLVRQNSYLRNLESCRANAPAKNKPLPHVSKQPRFEPIENLTTWTKNGNWCTWVHFF